MTKAYEPLAVVGIGCLFPESDSLEEYWSLIKNGQDAITGIPYTHWSPEDYFDNDPKAPDRTYGKTGAFLKTQKFDPLHYGISPQAVEATDTTQLLGMVVAEKALENAGYGTKAAFNRDRVSCILGVTGTLEMVIPLGARLGHPIWRKALKNSGLSDDAAEGIINEVSDSYVPWQEASFPGLLGNVVAGRIANRLDLGGTNSVVDAACASSLSAIRTAAMELQSGRADMVVTGGMDTFNDVFMYMCFSKTPALSPSGSARPFDAEGDGTVLGEGLGAVVLKRLSDAERDGDRVYAVIKGIGSSSDGRGQAIYAPSAEGQKKALRNAYAEAGLSPSTVQLVECHGTGTKVGDGIELEALADVYRDMGGDERWCTLGSVKSQIGHTKAAAGAAGFIKAVMALYHKVLPPSIKVTTPHPSLVNSPFIVREQPTPWLTSHHHPRRAAVSAFGFGGSNFHCVLEEHKKQKPMVDYDSSLDIYPLSASSHEELLSIVETQLSTVNDFDCKNFGRQLRQGKGNGDFRVGLLIKNGDYKSKLEAALAGLRYEREWSDLAKEGVFYGSGKSQGKLAILFSGQGAQYPNMLAKHMSQYPESLDSLSKAVNAHSDQHLFSTLYPGKAFSPEETKAMQRKLASTDRAQPAIGAVSAGLWKVLRSFGVQGDMFAGHSFGELTALFGAGVYDEETLHSLANIRGQLMANAAQDLGGMMAIFADVEKVAAFLAEQKSELVIANHNAPEQVVVAGSQDAIKKAKKALRGAGLRGKVLTVGAAFHSPIMAETVQPFFDKISQYRFAKPERSVYSNSLAALYSDGTDIKKVLSEQLAKPVRFVEELQAMYDDGARTFLEVGPSRILVGLVDKIFRDGEVKSICCDDKSTDGAQFYGALLELFALGYELNFEAWQNNWAPELREDPKFFMPINGANYRAPQPEKKRPKPSIKQVETVLETSKEQTPMSESKKQESLSSEAISQHLVAMQEIQKQNAELHKQFLDNQAVSQKIFVDLLQMYQNPGVKLDSASLADSVAAPSKVPKPKHEPVVLSPSAATKSEPVTEAKTMPAVEKVVKAPAVVEDTIKKPAGLSTMGAVKELIAEKTGYPVDMLHDEMSLEEDLGIDSIKRVEIFSALQESFPSLAEADAEQMSLLKTLADIANSLSADTFQAEVSEAPIETESALAQLEVNIEVQGAVQGGSDISDIMAVIADKTGYPVDMLREEMSLEEDLGIDSIKRVEIISSLQDKFPALETMGAEELGSVASIADLAKLLIADSEVQASPAQDVHEGVASIEDEPQVESKSEGLEAESDTLVMSVIAEKTGYPTDMLASEMNLEQDLGIDSIKRVEIFSSLADHFSCLEVATQEQLSELGTIGEVVSFLSNESSKLTEALDLDEELQELEVVKTEAEPAIEVQEDAPIIEQTLTGEAEEPSVESTLDESIILEDAPLEIPRQVLRYEEFHELDETTESLPEGAQIWVCDDGSNLARNIVLKLREKSFKPKLVTTAFVDRLKAPDKLDGLIILGPVKLEGSPSRFLNNCFKILKLCGPALRAAETSLFTVVTRNGGLFGLEGLDSMSQVYTSALSGLTKTVAHEWETVRSIHIDLARDFSDGFEAAFRLIQACMNSDEKELGVFSKHYTRPVLSLERGQQEDINLSKDDVILITGGARGVTAQIAMALASKFQGKLVLWGRTDLVEIPEWAEGIKEEAALKKLIMEHMELDSPKALEGAYGVLSRRLELQQNLETMRSFGAEVHYQAVDVSQEGQMRTALDEVEAKIGAITMLVHGAGILADKHIEDMHEKDYSSVVNTKIKLLNVLQGRELNLKYLAMFSSSTGRFGRKGQLAYAVANEALNKFASYYHSQNKSCHAVALNWGPWQGGMVNDGLAKLFAQEGIHAIPLELGAKFFMDELGQQDPVTEVVAIASPQLSSELENIVQTIDFASWPILRSHVMKGRGVVPSVLLMELLGKWARKPYPELKFGGMENFKVLKGITIAADESCSFQISLEKPVENEEGLFVTATLFSQSEEGKDWFKSASADVLLVEELVGASQKAEIEVAAVIERPSIDDVYGDYLFHGEELQGMTSIKAINDDGVIGGSLSSPTPEKWLNGGIIDSWNMDPLIIDVAFQLGVIWSEKVCGVRSLPTSFKSYRQYQAFPKEGCEVRMKIENKRDKSFDATIEFVRADQVIAKLESYEAIMDESLSASFKENSIDDLGASV